MRVKIGKYPNYFGPYKIAEKLCFWVNASDDSYYVHALSDLLTYGKVRKTPKVGEITNFNDDSKYTLFYKFLLWIDSFKERKVKVKIDNYDTFNLDNTLALIIHPALKEYKKHIQSVPDNIDQNDVPENMRIEENCDVYDKIPAYEKQWNYIVDEMIFAFEMKITDDWDDQFYSGQSDMKVKQLENGLSELISGENDTFKVDHEGLEKCQKRIDNGLMLFGKYYNNLWN